MYRTMYKHFIKIKNSNGGPDYENNSEFLLKSKNNIEFGYLAR
jgi:hypothetical protein